MALILPFIMLSCCSCSADIYQEDAYDNNNTVSVETANRDATDTIENVEEDEEVLGEEENWGYDLAIRHRVGNTLTIFMLFDFDKNIATEFQVHNRKTGEYKKTDQIYSYSISGDKDSEWQTNYKDLDSHLYFTYAAETEMIGDIELVSGVVTQYDYAHEFAKSGTNVQWNLLLSI